MYSRAHGSETAQPEDFIPGAPKKQRMSWAEYEATVLNKEIP